MNNRARAKSFLRTVQKGVAYAFAFQDETVSILAKYNTASSREATADDLAFSLKFLNRDGAMPVDDAARELELRAEILGTPTDKVKFSNAFDFSVVDEVNRELAAANWQPNR